MDTALSGTIKSKKRHAVGVSLSLEQMTGIEPACSAWEADILPLNYICIWLTLLV